MLAGRIATLKVKHQTIKALDGLSWHQKDIYRLLDIEDSKLELEQSRVELKKQPYQA